VSALEQRWAGVLERRLDGALEKKARWEQRRCGRGRAWVGTYATDTMKAIVFHIDRWITRGLQYIGWATRPTAKGSNV
jgi:hypothetical protein